MVSISMNKLPTIQSSIKNEVKFRGSASSHDYNNLQEDIFFDLANLFNIVNDFDNTLMEISQNSTIDNTYTQIRLNKLEALLKQKQAELDALKNPSSGSKKLFPKDFKNDATSEYNAFINTTYDQLNIRQHDTISKLYLYDIISDVVTIPDTLKIDLSPKTDNIKVFDNEFKKCFSKNANEYWVRKIIDNNASYVETAIEITLPDNIISNRDVNVIQLSPFPYASVDIRAIEYQLNGNWVPVPGIKSHKNAKTIITKDILNNNVETTYIENAENIKLCFKKTPMAKLRIVLRQNSFIEEQGNRVFYLGLKALDVNCEIVNDEYCDFYSEIEFADITTPKIITGIVPVFNNGSILSDSSTEKKSLISYEIYSVNDMGDREYIKNSFPLLVDKKKYAIVTKMYHDSQADINPSLYSLEVLYNNTEK